MEAYGPSNNHGGLGRGFLLQLIKNQAGLHFPVALPLKVQHVEHVPF
jgi:hypothetical protein